MRTALARPSLPMRQKRQMQGVQHVSSGHRTLHACTRLLSCTRRRRQQQLPAAAGSAAAVSRPPITSTVQTVGPDAIQWGSYVSSRTRLTDAVQEAVSSILGDSEGTFAPELAIVFASCSYGQELEQMVPLLRKQLPSLKYIYGSTAYGVTGSSGQGPVEVEGLPGVALSLGRLPGVRVSLVHTLRSGLPSEDASPEEWADLVGVTLSSASSRPGSPLPTLAEEEEDEPTSSSSSSSKDDSSSKDSSEGSSSADSSPAAADDADSSSPDTQPPPPAATTTSSSSSRPPTKQMVTVATSSSSSSSGSSSSKRLAAAMAARDPPVSFLMLLDPRFSQARKLMAGLDFAFPSASKLGCVVSAGQAHRRRYMYAWSAEGGVMAGSSRNLQLRQQRQQQRQQQQQQQQQQPAVGGDSLTPAGAAASTGAATDEEVAQQDVAEQQQSEDEEQVRQQQQREAERQKQRQQLLAEVEQLQAKGAPSTKAATGVLGNLFNALAALSDDSKEAPSSSSGSSSSSSSGSSKKVGNAWLPGAATAANIAAAAAAATTSSSSAGVSPSEEDGTASSSETVSTSSSSSSSKGGGQRKSKGAWWQRLFPGGGEDSGEEEGVDDAAAVAAAEAAQEASGLYMYGAAVMALQGPVAIEPLISQGYRSVSDKVWTIGNVAGEGRIITTLLDTTQPAEEREQPALMALYDMLLALGVDPEQPQHAAFISELTEKLALAVARDALSADKDITPEDFQVISLEAVDEKTGAFLPGEDVRSGYRLKLVLRDQEGVQQDLVDKLLALKRADLSAVLTATPRAQAFGALLMNDIARGTLLYGEPGVEVGLVGQYLPVPLAGLHASAEVSSVKSQTSMYEVSCAVGILRALPQADTGA